MEFPFSAAFFKLNQVQSNQFLNLPESGMGYQILQSLAENYEDSPIVTNGEYIIGYDKIENTPLITDFENLDIQFGEFSNYEFQQEFSPEIVKVKVNSKFIPTKGISKSQYPPYLYKTRHGDEFRRISAFRKDRRILPDGSVLPETYATTVTDLGVVPSGLAAVARYALPNRLAACYIYKIIPEPGTHVYFGTVTPNYGLCGGGVEVFFPNGCDAGSAKLIGTIPEK